MKWFKDGFNRHIRLTDERKKHIDTDHPEMNSQINKIKETLLNYDIIIKSKTDLNVELIYKHYDVTPVTKKYLCVVIKKIKKDIFIITAYFNTIGIFNSCLFNGNRMLTSLSIKLIQG